MNSLTSLLLKINLRAIFLVLATTLFAMVSTGYADKCYSAENIKQSFELPEATRSAINIDAGFGWGIFSGTVRNNNQDYYVTELVFEMTPIHDHHSSTHSQTLNNPRIHKINIDLPPLTKTALSIPLPSNDSHIHDFEWKLIKAIGYSVK